jgi:ubiquinone/menaquinone biosynthesis C-methylase UbiE
LIESVEEDEKMSTQKNQREDTAAQHSAAASRFAGEETERAQVQPPGAVLMQLSLGSLVSQAVHVAAKLGIADLLAAGAKSAEELARECGAHAPSLYRVLRALAAVGVFAEREDGRFEQTPTSEPLRSDVPGSVRDAAIFMGEEWHWRVWGHTYHSVMTGEAVWERANGAPVFEFLASNPEAARIFDRAMTSMSKVAIAAVLEAYDFNGIEKIVDVAGGEGGVVTSILNSYPQLKGVLFDLGHVIENARRGIEAKGLGERCELVAGDFFESVPAGADAYVMKHIIHDWDDARATVILRNIALSMRESGRVLLIESVITPTAESNFGKILDIEMLTSPGGKERTAEEYRDLFAGAGLRLTRIVATKSPYSVIEAVKA